MTSDGWKIKYNKKEGKKVYEDSELEPDSTIKKYLIVQKEGHRQVSRASVYYSLDAIISVGI